MNTPPRRHSSIGDQQTSPQPSTSAQPISSSDPVVFTPEAIRPLPKAPPRKSNKGRKTRKSTIYTDTPEKEEIRKEHEIRLKRTKAKQVKKRFNGGKNKKNITKRKKIHSRKFHQKRRSATALFVYHHIQRANLEKSGYNAPLVNCGLTKNVRKVVLAMFATIVTRNDAKLDFCLIYDQSKLKKCFLLVYSQIVLFSLFSFTFLLITYIVYQ